MVTKHCHYPRNMDNKRGYDYYPFVRATSELVKLKVPGSRHAEHRPTRSTLPFLNHATLEFAVQPGICVEEATTISDQLRVGWPVVMSGNHHCDNIIRQMELGISKTTTSLARGEAERRSPTANGAKV